MCARVNLTVHTEHSVYRINTEMKKFTRFPVSTDAANLRSDNVEMDYVGMSTPEIGEPMIIRFGEMKFRTTTAVTQIERN